MCATCVTPFIVLVSPPLLPLLLLLLLLLLSPQAQVTQLTAMLERNKANKGLAPQIQSRLAQVGVLLMSVLVTKHWQQVQPT
jgi:hypothetical protein